jgi:hypothetical protein
MKKIVALLLMALACDSGKTFVKASVGSHQEVDVPFDYRDCVSQTVTFTVVSQKTQSGLSVRVKDLTAGVEYSLDPARPIGNTYSFSPLPAAGHFYLVELLNGTNGKITANIYAQ